MIEWVEVPALPECTDTACGHPGCQYQRAEDERRLQVANCPGHEWEMELPHPDDDAYIGLRCTRCPAGIDDIYPDGIDLVYAEFDNGVRVDAGKHDSPMPLVVPVDVAVETSKHWTDYGWEYDAWVVVEQRGPIHPVADYAGGQP